MRSIGVLQCMLLCITTSAAAAISSAIIETEQTPPPPPQLFDPYRTWLDFRRVDNETVREAYLGRCRNVFGTSNDPASKNAVAEISDALSGLLDIDINVSCCDPVHPPATPKGSLILSLDETRVSEEGFSLVLSDPDRITISAKTGSGLLYGVYELIGRIKQGKLLTNDDVHSEPSVPLRVWNLWDNLDGGIERGYGGDSVLWPMATFDMSRLPEPTRLFLAPCNASDPYQLWSGDTFVNDDVVSTMTNRGSCVCNESSNPLRVESCDASDHGQRVVYRRTTRQIEFAEPSSLCVDVNHGVGPELVAWACHASDDPDFTHQQFLANPAASTYDDAAFLIESVSRTGQCVARRVFPPPPVPGTPASAFVTRVRDMLRMLKSSGINGVALNNVNACGNNANLLRSDILRNVSANLFHAFEDFAITPYFSACFASPFIFANISCDPLNNATKQWWTDKFDEILEQMPNFGGVLVKADSEGNKGPQAYNRSEAEGANMLARALRDAEMRRGRVDSNDVTRGIVMWRAFVYGGSGPIASEDRAKQAYDTFLPLDGKFDANVLVQVKNGPMDFQVREPLSPLLTGALQHTNLIMEVQAAQEYTGQQVHVVNLLPQWKSYLDFDTLRSKDGVGPTIADILSSSGSDRVFGMAAVSNLGNFQNWTGHVLSQSNTYGFGRIAWNPHLPSTEEVNEAWTKMTFGDSERVRDVVVDVLERSWRTYERYTSPLGIGFMCEGGVAGGNCAPPTEGPGPGPGGAECPHSPLEPKLEVGYFGDAPGYDHYWLNPCSNYGYSNYSATHLGCDRTSRGTGYSPQYGIRMQRIFDNVDTCPFELLLFFHNVAWNHSVPDYHDPASGNVTLLEYICDMHDAGVKEATSFLTAWETLRADVDGVLHESVRARFLQQINDASVWSDVIKSYYRNVSGSSA